MNRKFFTMILLLIFSVTVSAQTTTDYKTELDLIFNSFKEHDYEQLKPLLDSNVKIGDLPTGMNDVIIPQIIEQMPTPDSYRIVASSKEGENTRIETIYTILMMPEMKRNFTFNKEGKLIDFDVMEDVITETRRVGE
ncbi:MAG: hypothetical protein Q4G18_09785 [Myroides sp.]|nr:hypothetical protein [Myroides sp.]